MSKVSIASIVVALGFCASGSALAAPAADGADWAKAQVGEDSGSFYLSQQQWQSARTRAELRQEVVAAQRSGDAYVLHGEDSGSFYLSQQPWQSARTRAELRQEVVAAQRSGDAYALHGEDSGSFYLSRAAAREAVAYAGTECGIDTAPRAALQAAPTAR